MTTELTTSPVFPAVAFSVTEAELAALEEKYRGFTVEQGDKKGYLALTQGLADVRGKRTSVEARRVELKAPSLEHGRLVDDVAGSLRKRLEAIEKPLQEQKKMYDAEVERIRREKEETERLRIAGIQSLIAAIANAPAALATATADRLRIAIERAQVMAVTESEYAEFLPQANEAKTTCIAALQDLLTARIAADEAEAARIAEQARIDAERKAEAERIAAEQAALAAERAEFQRQQEAARKEREAEDAKRRAEEAAEQARRDAEQKAAQAEIDRQRAELQRQQDQLAEQQRIAAEAAQREADAKAQKEAEKARKAAQAKLDAEIEAAKPERERMIAYVSQCIEGIPDCSTDIGRHMLVDVSDAMFNVLTSWKAQLKEAA